MDLTKPLRVLGVWAHPDDEAYLSAGLMARVASAGGHVVCVTATRGGRGRLDDDPHTRRAFEALRESELRGSLAAVGAHSLRILGHGDGELDAVPHEEGVDEISRAIDEVRPDVVLTFGPDGITFHPDHVIVSRWVTDAWCRVGRGALLYATMTHEFLAEHRIRHEQIGLFEGHEPFGWDSQALALRVDLDEHELDRKRGALAADASQTAALAGVMGEAEYRTWWRSETFRHPTPAELGGCVPASADARVHGVLS